MWVPDAEALRSAICRGTAKVDSRTCERIVALHTLRFRDLRAAAEAVGGELVYLILAMTQESAAHERKNSDRSAGSASVMPVERRLARRIPVGVVVEKGAGRRMHGSFVWHPVVCCWRARSRAMDGAQGDGTAPHTTRGRRTSNCMSPRRRSIATPGNRRARLVGCAAPTGVTPPP
jgi:hypothetical protein